MAPRGRPAGRGACSESRRGVAGGRTFVEHDLPPATGLAAPDRVEDTSLFAVRILHGTAAQGQVAGVENFDDVRLPRERGSGTIEVGLPGRQHGRFATLRGLRPEEDRVLGNELT